MDKPRSSYVSYYTIDNSRIYKVSFIGNDGEIIPGNTSENVWITAKAMNSITTHTNKKKKYVYDKTIMAEPFVGV